jgi:hypothetical protein
VPFGRVVGPFCGRGEPFYQLFGPFYEGYVLFSFLCKIERLVAHSGTLRMCHFDGWLGHSVVGVSHFADFLGHFKLVMFLFPFYVKLPIDVTYFLYQPHQNKKVRGTPPYLHIHITHLYFSASHSTELDRYPFNLGFFS